MTLSSHVYFTEVATGTQQSSNRPVRIWPYSEPRPAAELNPAHVTTTLGKKLIVDDLKMSIFRDHALGGFVFIRMMSLFPLPSGSPLFDGTSETSNSARYDTGKINRSFK